MYYEVIGITASIFLLASMSFNSVSYKTNLLMRFLNTIGNLLFVIYGICLQAWSTAICNSAIILFNIVNVILLIRNHNKEASNSHN